MHNHKGSSGVSIELLRDIDGHLSFEVDLMRFNNEGVGIRRIDFAKYLPSDSGIKNLGLP